MRSLAFVSLAALGFSLASADAQAPITWNVSDIVDIATDVSTRGAPCIAVNMGPEVCEKEIAGVHFQADRSHWTRKILQRGGSPTSAGVMYFPDWTSGGYVFQAPYNRTAPNIGARHAAEPEYNAILKDGRHTPGGTHDVTCTISGLTAGSVYEIQIFYGNAGRPTRITEWDDGNGGRIGAGGIYLSPSGTHFGQVATGTFTAVTGFQSFTNHQHPATATEPETHNACSAIQVRELTPRPRSARATYYGEGTPGTNNQPLLGGTACSPGITFTGAPLVGTSALLTAENSQDAPSAGLLVFGAAPLSVPFAGGTLLVAPSDVIPVPIPQPISPYAHDHELQVPVLVPLFAGAVVYLQLLQADPGAVGNVSMTAGMKIEVGF